LEAVDGLTHQHKIQSVVVNGQDDKRQMPTETKKTERPKYNVYVHM